MSDETDVGQPVNGDALSPPQPHYGTLSDERLSAEEMDEKRKQNLAYEYLCHLEEAKVWIQACINEELPPTTELEEGLRNGVYLAKLGHFFAPTKVSLKKIYDREQTRFKSSGLHFRHTDNINHWFLAMEDAGLPQIFYPETTDIYDRKNMPRAIYCIHALSLYLFKLGLAPQIQDLYGKVEFTEEEISAMRKELEKYGINMPAFSKIGGILATELSVDDAALHAAIIVINEAIDKQNAEETMAALQIPAAMLLNLVSESTEEYQFLLYDAKQSKAEIARNKSIDPDITYEMEAYDELLTQAEIQGNINKVNTIQDLNKVNEALCKADKDNLLKLLKSSHLGLKNINDQNIEHYMNRLQMARQLKMNNNGGEDVMLDKDEIQQAINEGNLDADTEYQKQQIVLTVNSAVGNGDHVQLMRALQNPAGQFPAVYDFAGPLYLEEFVNMKAEKQGELDYEEIFAAVKVLSAIALINQAVELGDSNHTFETLVAPDAHITDLDEHNAAKYQSSLVDTKNGKQSETNCFLTHHEISGCVDQVNVKVHEEHEKVLAIGVINDAIDNGDSLETLETLKCPSAKLENVDDKQHHHYLLLLVKEKKKKAEAMEDEGAVLWWEEIQNSIHTANRHSEEALKMSACVTAINNALSTSDLPSLLANLGSPAIYLHSVTDACGPLYMERLQEAMMQKTATGDTGSGWVMNRTKEGHKFFYNAYTGEYSWSRSDGMEKDSAFLTRDEIQQVVIDVTSAHDRELLYKANEKFIILIQAHLRGYLTRRDYNERLSYMNTQLPAIVKIQSLWRGYNQRKKYNNRIGFIKENEDSITRIQAAVRMWLVRKEYRQRLKYFHDNEDSVVKIQAFFRSNKAKHDYTALMHEDNPSISVVQRFVHLLDASDTDYSEELQLQKLRTQAVKEIKSLQQLESDLDQMDIKIGLLIKNRITLQDVVLHNRNLKKHAEHSAALAKGLKALSKECHDRLEAYQHLFYLLQTNPTYLAKLIFEMPQNRTNKFMESVIYSLFNYGSNSREEFLLIRLFKTALEEEIESKVDKMTDIVTGNPLVVKMIVGFNRNQRGQNALREMLNPLITEVIEDRNLRINTNPVEVYKTWINLRESQTGVASGMTYDPTPQQALEQPEVVEMIQQSIDQLQQLTDKFLTTILNSLHLLPYGMRYMAKVLQGALVKKFPDAPEKDALKIVGNLLYYRYINSAIVAPDAFDIINVGADKALTNDQRRNLGSVAKILQFAAANKGFGGESSYLGAMNGYIREAHEKFKKYCMAACDVEEPEYKFNIDQFTDVSMITKPVIYISVQEICDTHQLLLEHQDMIAPDHSDPLHELLEDLVEVPEVNELIGLKLTELSVVSVNFWKRFGHDSVAEYLQIQIIPQEEIHQALVRKRDLVDKKVSVKEGARGLVRNQSILGDTRQPLHVMKVKVKKNLQNLELKEMVTRKNHYQDLVNLIAQDIRNQRRYRNSRKQELYRLRRTLEDLNKKRAFYESQIDYYNEYVKTCLENLQKKGNNRKSRGFFRRSEGGGKEAKSVCLKYSGARLHEKGVILEIEGLPTNQFKNVQFEIKATPEVGVFEVNAKFMGVEMDKVTLVFQDLLQQQYEGVAVIEMFSKAKVNVNLLIFLLNRKFYGRQE
ncbi:hypothetical protein ScPMuIL_017549 [Solemya velum]